MKVIRPRGAQGERIEKSGGATLTSVWDGGMIAMDLPKLSDVASFRGYLNGAGNNGMVRNGVWTPRIPDRAGSTAMESGALTNYEGYGSKTAGPSLTATSNPYGYDGYYTDAESGLCYLNARYYDPTTQRFTQQDPALDGGNWYGYCGGDPVNHSDPSGLSSDAYPGHCLSSGSTGAAVKKVQNQLKLKGCKDENNNVLVADGIFGKHTKAAVKKFQKKAGIGVDGIVGKVTWGKLFPASKGGGETLSGTCNLPEPVKGTQPKAKQVQGGGGGTTTTPTTLPQQAMTTVDNFASGIYSLLTSISCSTSTSITLLVTPYFTVTYTLTVAMGNGPFNISAEVANQKLMFKSFSSSAHIGALAVTGNSKGNLSASASASFGNYATNVYLDCFASGAFSLTYGITYGSSYGHITSEVDVEFNPRGNNDWQGKPVNENQYVMDGQWVTAAEGAGVGAGIGLAIGVGGKIVDWLKGVDWEAVANEAEQLAQDFMP